MPLLSAAISDKPTGSQPMLRLGEQVLIEAGLAPGEIEADAGHRDQVRDDDDPVGEMEGPDERHDRYNTGVSRLLLSVLAGLALALLFTASPLGVIVLALAPVVRRGRGTASRSPRPAGAVHDPRRRAGGAARRRHRLVRARHPRPQQPWRRRADRRSGLQPHAARCERATSCAGSAASRITTTSWRPTNTGAPAT